MLALLIATSIALISVVNAHPHILDTTDKIEVHPEKLLEDLRQAQVIFMGEFHNHVGHHQAQLSIIKALDDNHRPLAIGVEMFRRENQDILDLWTNQELKERDFLPIYRDNWSMWQEYRAIFRYARYQKMQMIGLNIPRAITSKVAQHGFRSLSEEERQLLGDVQCQVNPVYSDYISQAMGGHGGHGDKFLHFCEAQLLWDTLMAKNLVDFLNANPDYQVVVLAGSGHAWKFGIPRKMLELQEISYRVILPEVEGRVDRSNVTPQIADYLWLDVGEEGWSF